MYGNASNWDFSLFYVYQLDGSSVVKSIPAVMGQFQEDIVQLQQDFLLFWLAFDSISHKVTDHKTVGIQLCLRGVILQLILTFSVGVARGLFLILFGDELWLLLRTELDFIVGSVIVDRFWEIFSLEEIWHLKRNRHLRLLRKERTLLILYLLRDILSLIQKLEPRSLPIPTLPLPHTMIVRRNRLIVIILDPGIQLFYVVLRGKN